MQVDDGRGAATDARPVLQFERHADAACDRLEVDHRIGRAADRGVDADGVLEGLPGQHLGQAQVLPDHVDDAHARQMRQHVAARVDGRDGGVVRQRGAQRFRHASHGRGRAHGVAGAGRARMTGLGGHEVVHRKLAGLDLLVQLPDGGARADVATLVLAVEHRPAADHDGRQVDAGRAHQERRGGLVAADQQHHGVHRVTT
jgi:hypothetical protein